MPLRIQPDACSIAGQAGIRDPVATTNQSADFQGLANTRQQFELTFGPTHPGLARAGRLLLIAAPEALAVVKPARICRIAQLQYFLGRFHRKSDSGHRECLPCGQCFALQQNILPGQPDFHTTRITDIAQPPLTICRAGNCNVAAVGMACSQFGLPQYNPAAGLQSHINLRRVVLSGLA
ncbi:hypothetical protein [Chitinilyticum aquatile]|uniref:hypothetical protein n=1 Tax=Chitinilyticum aquatile TaxID=362520 RepID=UPI00138AFBCF|nr:hypothetical protein [Chitinilyticum aquatile]